MDDGRIPQTLDVISEALRSSQKTIPQYLEYDAPPVNEKEWLRYSCIPTRDHEVMKEDPLFLASMARVRNMVSNEIAFRVGFLVCPITWGEDGYPVLPFSQRSDNLRKTLLGCNKAVLFAATIGSGIDRLIRRYEKSDPRLGLLLQGHGAERVESLCDLFNSEVEEAAKKIAGGLSGEDTATVRRYSPGYGDLPIEVQRDFLPLLDAQRRMGITLSESCLMAPSKSVTAIIGVK